MGFESTCEQRFGKQSRNGYVRNVADMTTMRYFYNLGCEYFRQGVVLQQQYRSGVAPSLRFAQPALPFSVPTEPSMMQATAASDIGDTRSFSANCTVQQLSSSGLPAASFVPETAALPKEALLQQR